MQIITIEDADFPDLLQVLQDSKLVGKYWREGKLQIVKANRRFMMITPEGSPEKIAIRPARNQMEAEELAKQYLRREEARGNEVERSEDKSINSGSDERI